MSRMTIPVSVPQDLERQIREAAKNTRLSVEDVLRQSIALGLPALQKSFSAKSRLTKPLTREEARQCYEEPNPEFDALEHHMASLPSCPPKDE